MNAFEKFKFMPKNSRSGFLKEMYKSDKTETFWLVADIVSSKNWKELYPEILSLKFGEKELGEFQNILEISSMWDEWS